ncbi:MAG TPA: CBS domain-containing protein [Nitrospiria bacterium]|jgi:acetoin utilization protein AcuB
MLVKEMMTPNPHTIESKKTIQDALLLMYQHDIRRLPVMDGNMLIGIVSDRDIKQVIGRPPLGVGSANETELTHSILGVMTHNAVTVHQDADIRQAIELMAENKFSGLPVMNHDQQLVGIISALDILRYTLDLLDRVEGK